MVTKNLLLLSALVLPMSVNAQFPLDSVLILIEQNNPELKQYDTRIKALDAYAQGARSWEPPRAGAGVFMTPYKLDGSMGAAMFSVEQMIPNPRKQQYRQDYMQSLSNVEIENRNFTRNELIAGAKELYSEGASIQRKISIQQKSEEVLNFILEIAEMRYTYQKEELSNIYKARSSLYKLQNEQAGLENELQQKKIGLNTLMFRDQDTDFSFDTGFSVKQIREDVDTTELLKVRSDLRAIDQSIEATRLNLRLEKSKRLPDFGIRYDHMNTFSSEPNQFTLMGMVTIPIAPWSSREYKANVTGMEYELEYYRIQKQNILNEITGKLQETTKNIETKKNQLILFEQKIIPAMENGYQAALKAYEQNTGDLFKVLDAWEALLMTQMQNADLMQELLLMQVNYERELEQR